MYYKFILRNYVNPLLVNCSEAVYNCALFKKNGKHYLIGRTSNYSFFRHGTSERQWPQNTNIFSDETLYDIDLNTGKCSFNHYLIKDSEEKKQKYTISGAEDVRHIAWNDKEYVLYSDIMFDRTITTGVNLHCDIVLNELNDGEVEYKKKFLTGRVEKNWQPIESMPMHAVYGYNPYRLINLDTCEFINMANPEFDISQLRGSTQVFKYKNRLYSIVHSRDDKMNYSHYFVRYNDDMTINAISEPFSFFGFPIEFTPSVCVDGNKIFVPVSVYDKLTYIFKIDEDILNKAFDKTLNDDSLDYDNLITTLVNTCNDTNNLLGKLMFLTHAPVGRITAADVRSVNLLEPYSIADKFILQNRLLNGV